MHKTRFKSSVITMFCWLCRSSGNLKVSLHMCHLGERCETESGAQDRFRPDPIADHFIWQRNAPLLTGLLELDESLYCSVYMSQHLCPDTTRTVCWTFDQGQATLLCPSPRQRRCWFPEVISSLPLRTLFQLLHACLCNVSYNPGCGTFQTIFTLCIRPQWEGAVSLILQECNATKTLGSRTILQSRTYNCVDTGKEKSCVKHSNHWPARSSHQWKRNLQRAKM